MKIDMVISVVSLTTVLPLLFPGTVLPAGACGCLALLKEKEAVVFNVVCAGNKIRWYGPGLGGWV